MASLWGWQDWHASSSRGIEPLYDIVRLSVAAILFAFLDWKSGSTRNPPGGHHDDETIAIPDDCGDEGLFSDDADVSGIDMFVRQACLQFKLFTGHDGPAYLMREVIRRTIGAVKV